MDVDRDDGMAAGDFRSHQPGQADRTDPEYGKGVACLRTHGVEHRAGSGLAAAGERPKQFERRIFGTLTAKRSFAMA